MARNAAVLTLADRAKKARDEQGLTMFELAVKSGLSISAIQAIESGRTPTPQIDTVDRLAKALGLTIADLWQQEQAS